MHLKNKEISQKISSDLEINSNKTLEQVFKDNNLKQLKSKHSELSCFKWAMQTVGLKQYSKFSFDNYNTHPLNQNIPELEPTQTITPLTIVTYRRDEKSKNYTHVGIVSHTTKNNITVISIWGNRGLLIEHPIGNIPQTYGHYADFYKKI